MKRFFAIFKARNLEFFRDRGTVFWNILFPVLLILGFSFAFSNQEQPLFKIGIISKPEKKIDFLDYKYLNIISYDDQELAFTKLRHHQIDMILDPQSNVYYINELSSGSYISEKLLSGSNSDEWEKQTVIGKPIRYIDWVVPGILGMNIMFSCLIGVGFIIVRYRKNGVLKRFKATPISAFEFILAQVFSRFSIMLIITLIIYTGCNFIFNFVMEGSYLVLLLLAVMGIICMISMGLMIASRFKSEELAGGIMNVSAWPMMIFSGVWFSLEGSPKSLQIISQFLPLTHFVGGAREVMLDGAGLTDVLDHIGILAVMTAFFILIGTATFKWE